MYDDINTSGLRVKLLDQDSNSWRITYHAMDHVEYKNNPRRRTIGYNAIFDEYINLSSNSFNDEIGFCESILTPYLEIFGYQSTKIQFQHQDIINQLSRSFRKY